MGVREIVSLVFLTAGFLAFVVSAVGVLRFREFYCRLHTAGIGSSLGLMFSSIGLFLHEGLTLTGCKLLLVFWAVAITGPIGTHIIAKAAYRETWTQADLPALTPDDQRKEL